ncbi:MAG: YfgM family protein [Gemmatimonadaceae bacterium]
MPRTGAPVRPDLEERTESLIEWLRLNAKLVSVAAAVILAVGAGVWFYQEWKDRRQQNAARALGDAQMALAQNNTALAQSELRRVITRYDGTPAGRQASILMAQVLYGTGKYQEGIDALQRLEREGGDAVDQGVLHSLLAAGYEQLGKLPEAGEHYKKASETARFELDQDTYLANAARVYSVAGNTAEAKRIWQQLAEQTDSPLSAEARVRLGELEATARGG